MKHFLCCFCISAVLAVWQGTAGQPRAGEWGAVTNNMQMSISVESNGKVIKSNQPVRLWIRYRNVSTNQTFRLYRANAIENDPGYSFLVISPSGKDASPKGAIGRFSLSGALVPVAANQMIEFEFNLSRLCRFDQIGSYKIIAAKAIWAGRSNEVFTVVSNPVYVSVGPNQ